MPSSIDVAQRARAAQSDWLDRVALAETAIPIVGTLHRERNVISHVHGRKLVNRSATQLLRALRPRQAHAFEVDMADAMLVLRLAFELGVQGVSLDLGALLVDAPDDATRRAEHVRTRIVGLQSWASQEPTDVVLYGFGRIGRLLARILVGHANGNGLRLRAIVVRSSNVPRDLEKRANLLRNDSVHGVFDGTIEIDTAANTILANGTLIQVIYADDPATVDYTAHGIRDALVVDNTGRWRDEEGLAQHLASPGVARVLLHRAGEVAAEERRLRDQPRRYRGRRRDRDGRVVHDQRDHARAQGARRRVRHPPRSRRDGALLHERPEPHRQLPQGRSARAVGGAQHGHQRARPPHPRRHIPDALPRRLRRLACRKAGAGGWHYGRNISRGSRRPGLRLRSPGGSATSPSMAAVTAMSSRPRRPGA